MGEDALCRSVRAGASSMRAAAAAPPGQRPHLVLQAALPDQLPQRRSQRRAQLTAARVSCAVAAHQQREVGGSCLRGRGQSLSSMAIPAPTITCYAPTKRVRLNQQPGRSTRPTCRASTVFRSAARSGSVPGLSAAASATAAPTCSTGTP